MTRVIAPIVYSQITAYDVNHAGIEQFIDKPLTRNRIRRKIILTSALREDDILETRRYPEFWI